MSKEKKTKVGMIGKKVGMTQVFKNGSCVPVTAILAGPCVVVQKKTPDTDGYHALKLGFEDIDEKKLIKPRRGIFKKLQISPKKYLREFRVDEDDVSGYEVGQEIKVGDVFVVGEKVDLIGRSKGKGFQSTIKRFGQSGGRETHGSMYHRRPGSMGSNTDPARVFKGKRLPGHMGAVRVTVQNLEVVEVYEDENLILVKGAVPGPKGTLVMINYAVKSRK